MKSSISIFLAGMTLVSTSQATTVYTESNRADGNSILAYEVATNGSLVFKSETPTGGQGFVDSSFALGPFDSDQEIISNPEKTLVFAVNSGSNSISVFNTHSNGDLTPVLGSPFLSHGVNPVSVGIKGNMLVVVNKHGDPAQAQDQSLPNYTTFNIAPNGVLTWTGYQSEVSNGSSPSQALIDSRRSLVFGADFLGGIVRAFKLNWNGALIKTAELGLPSSQFASSTVPRLPLGLSLNPLLPILYVGMPTANKIGVYHYNDFGTLHFSDAFGDSGSVVCWLTTNKEGTRLYASNTADSSVTVYDIGTDPNAPKEIQKIVLENATGGNYQLQLSPDESSLVVLTERFQATTPQGSGNQLHVLQVNQFSGMLTETPNSSAVLSLPGDTRPQGVLVQ